MQAVRDSLDLGERLPHFVAMYSSAQATNEVSDFVQVTGNPVLLDRPQGLFEADDETFVLLLWF